MSSPHLRQVFNPEKLRKIATETERLRVEHGADIVVVRGLSGTLVASAMSAMFGTPFAVARKPNEISHGVKLEFIDSSDGREYGDWIIVDDLISSGETVRTIREVVEHHAFSIAGQCQGVVLYHSSWGPDVGLGNDIRVPTFYIGGEIDE